MSLDCQTICADARQIAKCPGYTAQSGRQLNLVLQDLSLHRDLSQSLLLELINVSANNNGPFTTVADYQRTFDLWFQIQGQTFFLDPVDLAKFDSEFKQPQLANYPYEFAVDSSPVSQQLPQLIYIYPQCNQAIVLNHRYYTLHDDIATPETSSAIPWFTDTDYLVHVTATRLMKFTDDERHDSYVRQGEEMLRKHLIMEGDRNNIPARIKLDPAMFRRTRSLRPTKVTG